MFGSLRSKLIASYLVVIFLSLVIAGSGFTYLVRAYQTQLRLNQLGDLSLPLTFQLRRFDRAGASPLEIDQFLKDQASQLHVRLILVNATQQITHDTGGTLVGQFLPSPSDQRTRSAITLEWGTLEPKGEQPLTFVIVESGGDRDGPRPPPDDLVLAVPEQTVSSAWLQLA